MRPRKEPMIVRVWGILIVRDRRTEIKGLREEIQEQLRFTLFQITNHDYFKLDVGKMGSCRMRPGSEKCLIRYCWPLGHIDCSWLERLPRKRKVGSSNSGRDRSKSLRQWWQCLTTEMKKDVSCQVPVAR